MGKAGLGVGVDSFRLIRLSGQSWCQIVRFCSPATVRDQGLIDATLRLPILPSLVSLSVHLISQSLAAVVSHSEASESSRRSPDSEWLRQVADAALRVGCPRTCLLRSSLATISGPLSVSHGAQRIAGNA